MRIPKYIRSGIWLSSLLLFLQAPCFSQTTPLPDDTSSTDKIIHALYDVISGPAGPRDWNRFRHLFDPHARMGIIANERYKIFTPEDYIQKNDSVLLTLDFYEKEIHRSEQTFGSMVQVFSTYESSYENMHPQGINAIELVYARGRWWITSILWQQASKDLKIPSKYLPE